jgi:hypothetical protein
MKRLLHLRAGNEFNELADECYHDPNVTRKFVAGRTRQGRSGETVSRSPGAVPSAIADETSVRRTEEMPATRYIN